MLVFCNALTGADKTAEQIGFKAIIKWLCHNKWLIFDEK